MYRLAIIGESRTQLENTTFREWFRRAGLSVASCWGDDRPGPHRPEDVWFGELYDPIPEGVPQLALGPDIAEVLTGCRLTAKARGTMLPRKDGGWLTMTIRPEDVNVSKGQDHLKPCLGADARRAIETLVPSIPRVSFLQRPAQLPARLNPGDLVSVDIEGSDGKPNIVGVSWSEAEAFVFPWSEEFRAWLARLFETNLTTYHNAAFDIPELALAGVPSPKVWLDTIVMAALYDPSQPLNHQTQTLTHVPGSIAWKGLVNHEKGPDYADAKVSLYRRLWADVLSRLGRPIPVSGSDWYAFYNNLDTAWGLALADSIKRKLISQGRWNYYLEVLQPLQEPLLKMGLEGMPIDLARLDEHKKTCVRHQEEALATIMVVGVEVAHSKAAGLAREISTLEAERELSRATGTRKFVRAEELSKLRGRFKTTAEFNPDSPSQLASLLYDHFGLPVIKTEKGGRSVKKEAIDDLASRVVRGTAKVRGDKDACLKLLEAIKSYNHWTHWLDTFLKPPIEHRDGWSYLITAYSLHRTDTGRLSSGVDDSDMGKGRKRKKKAQVQNVPKELRDMFVPPPGYVCVGGDWSGFQLALFLYFAEQEEQSGFHGELLRQMREGTFDPHGFLACAAYGLPPGSITKEDPRRQECKPYTFELLFEGTGRTTARKAGHKDAVGDKMFVAHEKAFRKAKWRDALMAETKKKKYVQTVLGWRRYFWEWKPKPSEITAQLIQATEADAFKCILRDAGKDKPEAWKWLTVTHDFIGLWVPEADGEKAAAWLKGHMEAPLLWLGGQSFRADVRIGRTWKDVS